MGRLIDADAIISGIEEYKLMAREPAVKRCMEIIKNSPTAYNVDKVVEQIKKVYVCWNCRRPDECNECTVGEVIEIIKKGGIE